ncbi:MAG: sigma-70 family RNA polymerase sigma factor [Gammaproteobacteria bacterium]|nr:sigma-70 family RNA polymerase sigma factor [Gammaproteobacteria bacterium]MDH5653550.1 sigma-70 family RNA polymerase sigma factor [Gammaproteobacteria bacterium]
MPNRKERERFERLMLRHLDAAYNLALWLMREPAEAEDVVQTAYLRAFEHFASFTGGNAAGWILTIVRNTAYNSLNKRKRSSNLISFDEVVHSLQPDHALTAACPGPEAILQAAGDRQRLMDTLQRLPVEFREAIYLREIEGYSYKEIADITQVPKGTVMSRLARARGQLQTLLTEQQQRTQSRVV